MEVKTSGHLAGVANIKGLDIFPWKNINIKTTTKNLLAKGAMTGHINVQ
jgi:hypothetical protein